jgi:hypothetical protein
MQRCCELLQHQQIVTLRNLLADKKDAAGMNGWHGSARAMHLQQRTAVITTNAADYVYMITVPETSKDVQLE